jgi:Neuraminidase (sialidase)
VSWRDFEGNSPKKNFGVSVVRSSNAGATWSKPKVIATLPGYNPFDGARDCGDGADACPSGFVFSRVPLEPRLTTDPTGRLPGVYSVVQAAVPSTIVPSTSSYASVGGPSASGLVAQGAVYLMRSTDNGKTWSAPYRVNNSSVGHQFFPDADALDGRLVVIWQDSRVDPAYSV